MSQQFTEELLLRLINDPALMKQIEKLAKATPAKPREKREHFAIEGPSYVNSCVVSCRLCGHRHRVYMSMTWDPIERLHRTSCHSSTNQWPALPCYDITQTKESCLQCAGVLMSREKEELIHMILELVDRRYYEHQK